ncbi:Mu transposase C-terminal domain-containing protein [Alysiella crassa]|uniref:Mu transposase, C-terminal n=1 Tax=Alysiella crassa TaxID=153491 RepID=A0A376BV08_9NEIS|nr:Mu transposase C-terminal domain-containing protein [Alysiella crassa]UOP06197.1 Mu transposase C-terminal domain-containing protein [Alysiella crassa]SSY80671.1 Mu transposase, C-terminal [Alysiella crassa]
MQFINMNELVKLNIQDLPKTVRGLKKKAERENWQSRPRKGRGGGVEYLISALPVPIREAVYSKLVQQKLANQTEEIAEFELSGSLQISETPKTTRKSRANPKGLPTVHRAEDNQLALDLDNPNEAVKRLTLKDRQCADARLAIVLDVLSIGETLKYSKKQSVAYFLEQMRMGVLPERISQLVPIANARINGKRDVSARTILNWLAAFKAADSNVNARLLALAPKTTNLGRSFLDETWLPRFLKIHQIPAKPKLKHSYEKFARQWHSDGLPENELPSIHVVRRVWGKMPQMVREKGRRVGQQYLSLLPYVKRNWHVLEPNQVWIIDGHSLKARIRHFEHGQPYVPEITMIVDGCTRRIVGFSITVSESCKAVADAIRMALRLVGLPVLIYSDNGKGETGRDITGELTGICPRLDIEHHTGMGGRPQGRGLIEGLWDVTTIKLAKEYATYHGSDMDKSVGNLMYRKTNSWAKAEQDGKTLTDEQKRYKEKMPTFHEFMADFTAMIDEYNRTPHSEHPKNPDTGKHYSPMEYWAFRMAQIEPEKRPEILSEDELQLLERSMEERTVSRGWLRFDNKAYFSTELAPYNGEKVLIAYDWDRPQDVGVYLKDGRFVCMAKLNGNTRDAFPDVESKAETQRRKRAEKQIKLKQNQIKRIEMDIKGGNLIENTPDFEKLSAPMVAANELTIPQTVEVLDVEVLEATPRINKYRF